MKKIKEKFKKLSVSHKVQLVVAVVVTIALLFVVPTMAWFSYQREIIKLQKVESPNSLFLSAAHREDETNFEIDGINADALVLDGNNNKVLINGQEQKITHKDYVFSVSVEATDEFTIQLAYTTNNPFTYEIYAAKECQESEVVRTAGVEFPYVEYELTGENVTGMPTLFGDEYHLSATSGTKLYYMIDTSSETLQDNGIIASGRYVGEYLNLDTSRSNGSQQYAVSSGTYHNLTYDQYTNVHINSEPVYWQAKGVSAFPGKTNSNKQAFSRHFILRVRWDAGVLDNTTKETDIVYVTVKATK